MDGNLYTYEYFTIGYNYNLKKIVLSLFLVKRKAKTTFIDLT